MKRVKSLAHLMQLANQRKCVIEPEGGVTLRKHRPAAFVIGWSARMVYYALKRGIYVYERKSK